MRTKEEALAALLDAPRPGSLYIHAKSQRHYVVVRCAILERTLEPCVVYRSLHDGIEWIRPLDEWNEVVEINNLLVKRFYLDPMSAGRLVACPACAGAGCSLVGQREDAEHTCDGSDSVTLEKAELMRSRLPG